MSEIDAASAGADFSLVIDDANVTPTFTAPPAWHIETHHVAPLNAEVHLRPSTATATTAPALLTFPDIAQSNLALSPFLSRWRVTANHALLDAASAHIHFAQPGHVLDAPDLPAAVDVSVPAQAAAVLDLLDRLNLPRVVAFAVGLGAAVVLRAAAKRPRAFTGLVLVSPALGPTSALERVSIRAETLLTRGLGMGLPRAARDRLLSRWLSDAKREDNSEVETALLDDVDRLNVGNVARMLAADAARDDAGPDIAKIKARVMLITGKGSNMRYHTAERMTEFDPTKMAWVDVPDAGSLVYDENPDRVTESVTLFLQGLPGFC